MKSPWVFPLLAGVKTQLENVTLGCEKMENLKIIGRLSKIKMQLYNYNITTKRQLAQNED